MPKGINRTTGEKINYDYTDEGMDEFQAAVDEGSVMPSYDAGGRVEKIQGYGDGGKVKKKTYKEKANILETAIPIKGLKGKVVTRRDLMEAYKEKDVKKSQKAKKKK
jgi:hypothetical protein